MFFIEIEESKINQPIRLTRAFFLAIPLLVLRRVRCFSKLFLQKRYRWISLLKFRIVRRLSTCKSNYRLNYWNGYFVFPFCNHIFLTFCPQWQYYFTVIRLMIHITHKHTIKRIVKLLYIRYGLTKCIHSPQLNFHLFKSNQLKNLSLLHSNFVQIRFLPHHATSC